jgi:WD40 repeat protein/tRNA A-37 threonylcarbamoyl transferase component Bud32
MNTQSSGKYELLDQIAEEFADRFRRGERPAVHEYIERYPELAAEIRELFPAVVEVERAEPAVEPAAEAAKVAPRQVGDYRILREIGRGGMGVVYEAEQSSLGRRVALKVLRLHTGADSKSLERFKREARAAAKLHHTNIVPVFEVGEDDEVCFYAMQYIQGQGLDQIIAELLRMRAASGRRKQLTVVNDPRTQDLPTENLARSMLTGRFAGRDVTVDAALPPPAEKRPSAADVADTLVAPGIASSAVLPGQTDLSALETDHWHYFESIARIGRQTASALAHAHARGIIHRDIKPSNLLLDACGTVWVTDFGLAKTEDGDLTGPGDILGTFRYMAPERFTGRSDPRSDVYALGMTLYELLVLRPAFQGCDRMTLIAEISTDEPPRPRTLDRRIPRDLETIVMKAIAKDPARRYQTAEAMAEDLRRFLDGEPIKARRTSVVERTRLWCRRHKALAGLYVVLFLAAAGSSLAAFYLNHLLRESEENRKEIARAERQARLGEAEALVGQAHGTRYSHRVGQRFETLAALEKAAVIGRELGQPTEWFDPLRSEAIACLALPDWRTLRAWEVHPPGTIALDCDSKHRLYARRDLQGHISVRRVDTDEEIAHVEGPPGNLGVDLSPDGRFLVAHSTVGILIWDVDHSPPTLLAELKPANWPAFHPDGRHLLVTRTDGSMLLYDLTWPQHAPRLRAKFDGPPSNPIFDLRGDRLAVATGDGRAVHILDAKSGKDLSSSLLQKAPIWSLAWHPTGNYLAAPCQDSRIYVWDTARGRQAAVLEGCRSGGIVVAFTPGGEFVVSQGWEGKLRFWHWRTGKQVLSQPGGSRLRFSPDGQFVVGDGNLKLVELAVGREYRTLVQQSKPGLDLNYWGGALHPDGRLLAVGMTDGVRLWDLETGDELAHIEGSRVGGVAFASDALLTQGPDGLFLWPIRHETQAGTPWQIGPPRLLNRGIFAPISCTRDGRLIAQDAGHDGTLLLHPKQPGPPIRLRRGPGAPFVSPDGRFVATAGPGGANSIQIWETERGKMVKELRLGGATYAAFSPAGQWLAVRGTDGGRILTVGTWEEVATIQWAGSAAAFSPDGNLLAVEAGPGVIRLLDPATGQEKARLEDPHQDRAEPLLFTPDGTRLVAVSNDGKAIHVWDLRRIRAELVEIGLDWEMPPYPESTEVMHRPLEVRVDAGSRVREKGKRDLTTVIDRLRRAAQADPKNAETHNNLAWLLLTGPEELRNAREALPHAQKADELSGGLPIYSNTLGVALYRNGKYREAVRVLEKSLEGSKGATDAFDLFFLAMCHQRLGAAARARECYARAARWYEERRGKLGSPWAEELAAFAAEARTVLSGNDVTKK